MSTNSSGQNVDLRTRRTQTHLRLALVALMAERGYDQTSVVDVCERAMVHRTTFYKHYAGKDDLLDDVIDDHLSRLVDPERLAVGDLADPADRSDAVDILQEIFTRAEEARQFYALLTEGVAAAALMAKLTHALGRHLVGLSHRMPSAPRTDARGALRAHLHAGIVVNTIAWTMRSSDPLSPAELAQMLADEFFDRRLPAAGLHDAPAAARASSPPAPGGGQPRH